MTKTLYIGVAIFGMFISWRLRSKKNPIEPVRDVIIDELVAAVAKEIYLDNSRSRFVKDAAETLADLVRGSLVGRDRYKRLLLGGKGVGKTALLQCLQKAAKCILERHGLYCVYLDYSAVPNAKMTPPPLEALIDGMEFRHRVWLRNRLFFASKHDHMSIVETFMQNTN